VLDRIVPGYYHRLNGSGGIETSTCCANTATEHAMMARLMIDSAVVWARDYRIDSFRFDLMGHQPRAAMERLQAAVDAATGRRVELLGEGWNFGEVADGRRFVQASQLSLNGSGIATFSDRARDAVRGGGCCDSANDLIQRQGWSNGLHYAPNALAQGRTTPTDLLRAADMVRVGLAGSIRDFQLTDHRGQRLRLEQIDYVGQPAGYVPEPAEVVNYVENHDNLTLFDVNAFKLPLATSRADRARAQIVAAAVVAFSQGIAYYHAGIEVLRSKSLDRNSYDSGDWFNRLDWTLQDNFFGTGLPPQWDNAASWPQMRPLLANAAIKPTPAEIAWTRDAFLDLLRIRASSTLFRLRTAADVRQRLSFPNTGPGQVPTVLVGHIDGNGYPGAGFREVLYFINADIAARTLAVPEHGGKAWTLHPAQARKDAGDTRPLREARVEGDRFTIPARSAVVYVTPSVRDRDRRRHRRLDGRRRAVQGAVARVQIRLVESEEIGTVGVGEATIPLIKLFNSALELDEHDFVRRTKGSFKLGIEFVNWGRIGDSYIHGFGKIGQDLGVVAFYHYWLKLHQMGKAGPLDEYSINTWAARNNKFMPARSDRPNSPLADIAYAYHFDAGLYARYLREYAEARGVRRTEGKVATSSCIRERLRHRGQPRERRAHRRPAVRRLLGLPRPADRQALKVGYVDWTHWLPCNRAVAVPCEQPADHALHALDRARRRLAVAHPAAAPGRQRLRVLEPVHQRGRGHRHLQGPTSRASRWPSRKMLRFVTGKREKFWNKNVVALGLPAASWSRWNRPAST
jgi:hypothetical protein